ncbi:MAG: hypothetical protein DMG11_25025 [Acidobacteria bacterium]|nr:MAG: hypothetical protein DMG11_25025 [Acidobacteriota bacterium]
MLFQKWKQDMRRIVKLLLSAAFWAGLWLWKTLRRAAGRELPGTCVVLYYHAVTAENRARFARQMDELKRWAKPIAADATNSLASGVHHAVVTFDDAFQSTAENAIPELIRRGIPSTIFAPTGYVGQHPSWTEQQDYEDRDEVVMSAEQLRRISSDLTSVESHTVTHLRLHLLVESDARRELAESKHWLEAQLGREIKFLSFPYGQYNTQLIEWSRQAGYKRVFTTMPQGAYSEPGEYVTGRVPIRPSDWRLEFRLKVLGGYSWLPFAFALRDYMNLLLAGRRHPTAYRQVA